MIGWGSLALIQCAAKNFAGLLVIRLLLAICEAGFFAGVVFYLTLFYKRNELGFRIAIFFGSALLAAAFSGLISFGVFQIQNKVLKGWMFLFLIEGGMTVVVGIAALFWLPRSAETAWFLNDDERAAARARSLRDSSKSVNAHFNMKAAFQTWRDWKFPIWMIICFTYPVAFSTTSNFLPQVFMIPNPPALSLLINLDCSKTWI
jgi:MFS family permease